MAIRINRYLSESGFCSRREADGLVGANVVTVNDMPANLGTKVGPGDIVHVEGERVMPRRAVNFTQGAAPVSRVKRLVVEKPVDKLPKWLVELRTKKGEEDPEKKNRGEKIEREPRVRREKPKIKVGSKKHTPKKSFN